MKLCVSVKISTLPGFGAILASKLSLLLYQVWSFDVIFMSFYRNLQRKVLLLITRVSFQQFDYGLQTEINHNFNTNVEQDIICKILVGYLYVTTILFYLVHLTCHSNFDPTCLVTFVYFREV